MSPPRGAVAGLQPALVGGRRGDTLVSVPPLIETRPFTIHPELYAWPSYRIFSQRVLWVYVLLFIAIAALLVLGLNLGPVTAGLVALGIVAVAFAMSYGRYRRFLMRPEHREMYRNCVVSLTDEELRQDYSDGSFTAFKLFAITEFRDLGDTYFVFATKRHAIVVPKTAFESSDESREFSSRLRASLGAAKP